MKLITKTTFAVPVQGKTTYVEPGTLIDISSDEAESLLERELAILPETPTKPTKSKEAE